MKVPLVGGAYTARSLIASCQSQINLFGEPNPEGSATPATLYPTPGLRLLGTAPTAGWRGLFSTTNGKLYGVCGQAIYSISSAWAFTHIGDIASVGQPVVMEDNSLTAVLVDGTTAGYAIDLTTDAVTAITADAFYGANRVCFLDTYLLFNKPGTPQMYSSDSLAVTFDPLWFANKSAYSDTLKSIAVAHRDIWLIGQKTSEIFIDTGAADFPFASQQGVFIDNGTDAPYSVAVQDNGVFWLSRDRTGTGIVLRGEAYGAKRISTFAIENTIAGYPVTDDAIGMCYQQGGHAFYMLTFPTADATWCYDIASGEWHQRAWSDSNGALHRHRASCMAYAYDTVVVGDWQNGKLYALDENVYTDDGASIQRIRAFPHLVNEGKRLFYRQFLADMQVGTAAGTTPDDEPMVSLRWSDTRGASWETPVEQGLGSAGEYLTSMQWQRLGYARDRVFEISWSVPYRTALQGAWIDVAAAST